MAIGYEPHYVASTGTISTYDTLIGPLASDTVSILSGVTVCNKSSSAQTFRIARCAATTPADGEFVYYGTTVPANESVTVMVGAVLNETIKYVRCSSSSSDVDFSASSFTLAQTT